MRQQILYLDLDLDLDFVLLGERLDGGLLLDVGVGGGGGGGVYVVDVSVENV